MSEAWLNFAIVILVQFVLFIIHALCEKRFADITHILGKGILSGIVLGLLFDLILGKSFSLFSYVLGFNALFLMLNATLFYGLFVANALLMQQARLLHFYLWTMVVGAVTEITNFFLHLWTWKFESLPFLEYLIVLSAGYFGVAILMATVWHVFGHRFQFISNTLRKTGR
ncbi:MAG: hypothetical protein P4M11_01740 [Candidatus Pacebacteria bacterium]|nr:hypothetical protein [Candidatus Paceibacterota bacterium]